MMRNTWASVLLALACLAHGALAVTEYVAIVDAGSSGSRIAVFYHDTSVKTLSMKQMQPDKGSTEIFKLKPGISYYDGTGNKSPTLAGKSLAPLIKAAKTLVPSEEQSKTKIFVYATAGMRMLNDTQSSAIYQDISSFLKDSNNSPFQFAEAKTLSGGHEGLFGQFSVNYFQGTLDSTPNPTAADPEGWWGALDCGGASNQITFKPSGSILDSQETFFVDQTRHSLYATSYMLSGQNQLLFRFKNLVVSQNGDGKAPWKTGNIVNPCAPEGMPTEPYTPTCGQTPCAGASQVNLTSAAPVTTPPSKTCDYWVKKLLHTDYECLLAPCAVAGRYQPAVKGLKFLAFSSYFYTANGLGIAEWSKTTLLNRVQIKAAADKFCASKWSTLIAGKKGDQIDYAKAYCFMGQLIDLQLGAYQFPANQNITFSRKVNGYDVSWALGAALYVTQSMPLTLSSAPPASVGGTITQEISFSSSFKTSDEEAYKAGWKAALGLAQCSTCTVTMSIKTSRRAVSVVFSAKVTAALKESAYAAAQALVTTRRSGGAAALAAAITAAAAQLGISLSVTPAVAAVLASKIIDGEVCDSGDLKYTEGDAAGIGVGCAVGAALLVFIIMFFMCRGKAAPHGDKAHSPSTTQTGGI